MIFRLPPELLQTGCFEIVSTRMDLAKEGMTLDRQRWLCRICTAFVWWHINLCRLLQDLWIFSLAPVFQRRTASGLFIGVANLATCINAVGCRGR